MLLGCLQWKEGTPNTKSLHIHPSTHHLTSPDLDTTSDEQNLSILHCVIIYLIWILAAKSSHDWRSSKVRLCNTQINCNKIRVRILDFMKVQLEKHRTCMACLAGWGHLSIKARTKLDHTTGQWSSTYTTKWQEPRQSPDLNLTERLW